MLSVLGLERDGYLLIIGKAEKFFQVVIAEMEWFFLVIGDEIAGWISAPGCGNFLVTWFAVFFDGGTVWETGVIHMTSFDSGCVIGVL